MVAANLYGWIDVLGRLVFAPAPIVSNSPSVSAAKTRSGQYQIIAGDYRIKEGKNNTGEKPGRTDAGEWYRKQIVNADSYEKMRRIVDWYVMRAAAGWLAAQCTVRTFLRLELGTLPCRQFDTHQGE